MRVLFASCPNVERLQRLREYAHALSHVRRHAIVRCLHAEPGLSVTELSVCLEMPPQTADRLWGELDKAHIVDLNGNVVAPEGDPEATLLELTLS